MSSITSCIVNEWTYEFAGLKETDRRVITRDMHELVKRVQKIKKNVSKRNYTEEWWAF